jgi:hypothetical protein
MRWHCTMMKGEHECVLAAPLGAREATSHLGCVFDQGAV